MGNVDMKTVEGFGREWSSFNQTGVPREKLQEMFDEYFSIFPWGLLKSDAVGFDAGCGSGRWARFVAPKVGKLHCVDASSEAIEVAKQNLKELPNCSFHNSSVDSMPMQDNSMDFGYSLGVLHHLPDTLAGLKACASKLKNGAPFLLYLYYALENRPFLFRLIWKVSDLLRMVISRLPHGLKLCLCNCMAVLVYFPLARVSFFLEKTGFSVSSFPLSAYRNRKFYSMRTDALDRFGTRLEKRFCKDEIINMLKAAGFKDWNFSKDVFWCVSAIKA